MGAREQAGDPEDVTLFLCGDVMTGRGIDQALPHPSEPWIYEPYATSALDYVELAERANGPIPRPVDFAYVWGDLLEELDDRAPDRRIGNLETSVTTSSQAEPKGINYRMHPANTGCLRAAGFDCLTLANNHVLDWGPQGLLETLETLDAAGIATAGAGRDGAEAASPAVLALPAGRVLVFSFGASSSGIPASWAAGDGRPGVELLPDLGGAAADRVAGRIDSRRRPGDLVVASIHWGGNWGYEIPRAHREFARRLVDAAGVDVVYGHSSHHPKAIECYRDRPILYGCGDFIDDYEGISGYEDFRSDLVLAYLVTLSSSPRGLVRLAMVPFRVARLRLRRAARADAEWLRRRLDRECRAFGSGVTLSADGTLALEA